MSDTLSKSSREELLRRILDSRQKTTGPVKAAMVSAENGHVDESYYKIDLFPEYQAIHMQRVIAERVDIESPFFVPHEGCARDTTTIQGRECINFGTYNYLALNGDPRVNEAARRAVEQYGTSASASRLVSGERPPHSQLEEAIARLYGTEASIALVSGHATNVTTIGTLLGSRDLVLHDRLIHNSILQGIKLSGAKRQPFDHNDWRLLDDILTRTRGSHQKVLICVEGLYGMDGDLPPMDRIVEIAKRHKALVLVDEAHSLGTVGKTGLGVREYFDLAPDDVQIWMGTFSKTLAGCGGYIAGSKALIELLRYSASGFVYSVGMPPAMAAASQKALEIMLAEPERVQKLQENARLFLELAQAHGLDTGRAEGYNVVPIITGSSLLAVRLSQRLFERGIHSPPIIHPAVEEKSARLRYFLSSAHSHGQIRQAVDVMAEELKKLQAESDAPAAQ